MPDAQDPPRPPDDGEGRKPARGGAKRTPAELETIVLSILRASPRPLGAYVIARQSRSLGVPLAPNQVYRILDRLRGRVRRVETLNAYCEVAGDGGAIMSCRACGHTATLAIDLDDRLSRVCGAIGFRPDRTIVEIVGLCAACARK
ncbi:transcriptional repressor [Sphingopyxis sp.]|uniref:Fur family transcriptional regulator n=1 Tax=Sphingopyxis sp. TaxID=1908224 RepID=UPI002DE9E793|nr:transcriptional repressor [Sphingopyxis sp.]